MPRRFLGVVVLVALAGTSLLSQQAQGPRPTFRAGVEYVEVDARVVDGKDSPVHNLTKADFKVFEDGKEQTIETFAAIDIPTEGTATETKTMVVAGQRIEPDVSQNQFRADDSRVFVILLDDRQIDARRSQDTLHIVNAFIDRIGPHDLAAIVSSSGRTDLSQTLTSNQTLLRTAANRFIGRKLESGIILEANGMKPRSHEAEQAFETRASLKALSSVVSWMGRMQGRTKVLVYVSEGFDYEPEVGGLTRNAAFDLLAEDEMETLAAATRSNVTIHTIDPRGLYAYDELTAVSSGAADPATSGLGAGGGRGQSAPGLDAMSRAVKAFKAEVTRAQVHLRAAAAETGGTATVSSNKFEVALDRIIAQHSTYYLLGYQTTNSRRDGRLHRIEVRVNGKGLKVISRRGYREADARTAAPATPTTPAGMDAGAWEALNSPLPLGDLPMTASVAAFRGADNKASVAVIVEAPADTIAMLERGGNFSGGVRVMALAVDRKNAVAASDSNRVNLKGRPETFARMTRAGFRAVTTLRDLGPGAYQVRVAMAPEGSDRRGSIWFDIEVPDFAKGTMAMSGLLIGSNEKNATPTADMGSLFADPLPVTPAASRQFRGTDAVTVVAEIYANKLAASAGADIAVIVKDSRSEEMLRRTELITAERFEDADGTYRLETRLPLSSLAPGDYVLSVEVTSPGGDPETITRAVPLRIVP